jgi:mannose-6-phosphate isomerase-like protein (cupin superfamily)
MTSTVPTTGPGDRTVVTLPADQIGRQPWQPVAGCSGVRVKELWRHGEFVYALLHYAPGAETPGHPHGHAHQHIWIVEGEAVIGGRRLPAGSYAHVPPGTAHPISATGPWGCVLLQTHMPDLPDSMTEVTAVTCQQ